MDAARPVGGGVFERALDDGINRLFARVRPRYLEILLAFGLASVLVVGIPFQVLSQIVLIRGNLGDLSLLWVCYALDLLLVMPTSYLFAIWRQRRTIAWLRGDAVDPRIVWMDIAHRIPRTLGWIVAWHGVGIVIPALTWYAVREQLDPTSIALLIVENCVFLVGTGSFVLITVCDLGARPAARTLFAQLPRGARMPAVGLSLRFRLLVLLSAIAIYTGLLVGSFTAVSTSRSNHILLVTVVTAATTVTLAGVLTLLVRYTVLSRIERIREALGKVRSGGADVVIVPTSADELDEVVYEFNDMVARLNAHEAALRASRSRIVAVADEERRRMERDLHDGAQQYLALLRLQTAALARTVAADTKATAQVNDLQANVDQALAELRNLAHGIYPAALEAEGLPAALEDAGRRATVAVVVNTDGVARLPRETEAAVYFCCLEALQNVSKYAGAEATATISLTAVDPHRLEFAVADDGVGFDSTVNGHGLTNMRDRIGALGGEVTIASTPGTGARISGWVPVG